MKLIIENTDKIVNVVDGATDATVRGRLWVGQTESGIRVQCVVTRIAVEQNENQEQFQRELQECRPPEAGQVAFPLRMVI